MGRPCLARVCTLGQAILGRPLSPVCLFFLFPFSAKISWAHSEPQMPALGRLPRWLPAAQTAPRKPLAVNHSAGTELERSEGELWLVNGGLSPVTPSHLVVSPLSWFVLKVLATTKQGHAFTSSLRGARLLSEWRDGQSSLSSRKLRQASIKFPTISVDFLAPVRRRSPRFARSPWPRLNSRGGRSLR